jgi:hypothetical protein
MKKNDDRWRCRSLPGPMSAHPNPIATAAFLDQWSSKKFAGLHAAKGNTLAVL